ncbi:hypothetical protein KDW_30600 [Dictyobacter vulcani]|uniref:Uncharacterized protein n=1 Tax=Dictyobacter vulcani TaxID=2607529 RepID=A0A5J4KGT9_9CHLR|nr:hypothetical protein [Dictyobacter vulcani]GER88898.1 hypothetical protein KDW_30600 [Dictyobacter vulcani]
MEKQLNVWIDENIKEALADQAQREKKTLKELIEETLRQETMRYNGQLIEQQALPLINDTIQNAVHSEMYRFVTHLEAEFHEHLAAALNRQHEYIQRNHKSITSLLMRYGEINRCLLYSQLYKAYGSTYAQEAHEKAIQKANREFPARKQPKAENEQV